MVLNKIALLPGLKYLPRYLQTDKVPLYRGICCDIYNDKIAVKRELCAESYTSIRIWETKALFNYWYNDMCDKRSRYIGGIDYIVNEDHIKIEYLSINDDEHNNTMGIDTQPLNNNEAMNVRIMLLNYAISVAKNNKKQKLIIDVHGNLRLYNKDYQPLGFEITDRKCEDNPFWKEAELYICG
jgi:hypothetical protein